MKKLKLKKRYWFLLFLVVVGIFAGIKYAQHNLAVKQERAAFEKSYKEVSERADRLSAVYKPDERKDSKTCDYTSAKFSKGSLGCGVNVELWYKDTSVEEANKILKTNASFNPSEVLDPNSAGTIKDVPYFYKLSQDEMERKVRQQIRQKFTSASPSCGVGYTYISTKNLAKEPLGLRVSMGCSGNAKAEYYPVQE